MPHLPHTLLNCLPRPRPHAPADCHHHHRLSVVIYAHRLCRPHRLRRAPSPAAVSTLSPPSLTHSSIARRILPVRHRRLIVAFKAVATTATAAMLSSSLLRSSPPCWLPPLPSLPHLPLNRPPGPPAPTGCHHRWLIVISLIAGGARATILSSSSSGFAVHSSTLLSPPSPLTSRAHPSISRRVLPIEFIVIYLRCFFMWRRQRQQGNGSVVIVIVSSSLSCHFAGVALRSAASSEPLPHNRWMAACLERS